MIFRILLIGILLNLSLKPSYSQVSLPHFFSDNMVLQQNDTVRFWGKDKAKTEILIKTSWGTTIHTETNKNGNWKLDLITPQADNIEHKIVIKGSDEKVLNNVMLGEVWFASGQSNMTMKVKGGKNQPITGSNNAILNSSNRRIRMWTSDLLTANEPKDDIGGRWEMANYNTTPNFSAVGYFFAEQLEQVLDVPVGIILSGWGGTPVEAWMDAESLTNFPDYSFHTNKDSTFFRQPSVLWNAMIHPFLGFKVKGMIWYQGESNWEQPYEYAELFPTMIERWRKHWDQGDIPFYYVQVSPLGRKNGNTAFIREAQEKTMYRIPNTGMVVIHDVGECWQIHPREKRIIGERLAYWAFYKDYNIKTIGYRSPAYKSMENAPEGRLTLEFETDPGGLSTFDKKLSGFQVAGPDSVFHEAKAHIKWATTKVIVWSDEVKNPVAARYLFDDCGEATLFSGEGLPVGSFRTDNWPDDVVYE